MSHVFRRAVAVAIAAAVGVGAVVTSPDISLPEVGVAARLASMSPKQADAYLAKHPEAALAAVNADPANTARWWRTQSKRDRAELLSLIPDQLGNLDGVDYVTRDAANRAHLASALRSARHAQATHPSATAKTRLASLEAIDKTLRPQHPHRYLVSLTDDSPALAAISIGNPDTARQITFTVPGMGTYTTDMQLWTQGAQNVYDEQGLVGAPHRRAVISWMGYVPPPQGIEASRGIYAQRGAPLLRSDIDGVFAVRASDDDLVVNVVSHSYGTTTTADALHGAPNRVYAVVFLGSAGIEPTVPNAAALSADHVYAAEAAKDPLARFGRESRTDPRSPAFGAKVFGVDGIPGADDAYGVTGHEPILHSVWNDNPFSSAWTRYLSDPQVKRKFNGHVFQFGYLDNSTESLYNVAVATTPGTDYRLQ